MPEMLMETIGRAFDALGSQERLRLFLEILDQGELSYSQIEDHWKTSSNPSYALRKLLAAGLLRNYYRKVDDSAVHSFYDVSNVGRVLGKSMISALETVLEPATSQKPKSKTKAELVSLETTLEEQDELVDMPQPGSVWDRNQRKRPLVPLGRGYGA